MEIPAASFDAWSTFNVESDVIATPEAVEAAGLPIITGGLLVDGDGAFTADERASIQALGSSVNAGDYYVDAGPVSTAERPWADLPSPDSWTPWRMQLVAALVGILIAGLVVTIGLSLTAAESRGERVVLAAVGAAPATQRRIAAAQATFLTLVAAVMAVPTALIPLAVIEASQPSEFYDGVVRQPDDMIGMPWATVAALVALLPLVSGAGAWLFTALAQWRPRTTTHQLLALD